MDKTSKRQVDRDSEPAANRTIRYQVIADDLRRRVVSGEFPAGNLLPSESELSAEYAASRVTVRRALEALRSERLVDSRQGFGWFVAADPLRQELHRLGTIESQLRAAGLASERRILSFSFIEASPRVRDILGERQVLEVRRLNLADGQGSRMARPIFADFIQKLEGDPTSGYDFNARFKRPAGDLGIEINCAAYNGEMLPEGSSDEEFSPDIYNDELPTEEGGTKPKGSKKPDDTFGDQLEGGG